MLLRNVTPARSRATLCGAFILALLMSGCHDSPTGPEARDLNSAEARWKARGQAAYTLEQSRECFCIDRGRLVRITVLNNTVQGAVDVETGQAIAAQMVPYFRTVNQLFSEIRNALGTAGATVDATYDPDTGIPTHVWIDPNPRSADEEFGYRSGNIHPLID